MGRRNETNRLAHKTKVDQKKVREQESKNSRKEKLKQIITQFNKDNDA